jgi:hypothetical protein
LPAEVAHLPGERRKRLVKLRDVHLCASLLHGLILPSFPILCNTRFIQHSIKHNARRIDAALWTRKRTFSGIHRCINDLLGLRSVLKK